MEILAAVIVAGIAGGLVAGYKAYKEHKLKVERSAYTYHDIATSWALWDQFVHPYHTDSEGNRVKPSEGVKTKYLDYDAFQRRFTPEEKIQMLEKTFGVERQR